MQIQDETFVKLMKQQTAMSMKEIEGRFLGRTVTVVGSFMDLPRQVESVSLNRHHGVVFKLEGLEKWFAYQQLEFSADDRTAS